MSKMSASRYVTADNQCPNLFTSNRPAAVATLTEMETYSEPASLALLYTLPEGRAIWGVTSLGDEVFVVREGASHIEVYHYTTLYRRLNVRRLGMARDLAACNTHSCLYVTDVDYKADDSKAEPWRRYAIHRVRVDGKSTSWWSTHDRPWGISVTLQHNVLVTFVQTSLIVEYSTEGESLRHIHLPRDVLHPLHASWLPSGHHLVVSHGDGPDPVHRLCAFDVLDNGQATTAVALDGLRSTSINQVSRESILDVMQLESLVGNCRVAMDVPGHIAVDKISGTVLVADVNNSRLLIVDQRLRRCSVLLDLAAQREFPVRLCLDETRCRLYVAYNGAVRDGRWTAGRVLVFFFGDNHLDASDLYYASASLYSS